MKKRIIAFLGSTPQVVLATVITVLVVAGIASATTIGTNISTDGSLNVTGTTTIDSGTFYVDTTNNKVGIGTITPQYELDINGNVNIEGNNTYKIEGDNVLSASTSIDSLYIGKNVGLNNIGHWNYFAGIQSGEDNTTGNSNLFIGPLSGQHNITGSTNTFLGMNAGRDNIDGSGNVLIGLQAGLFNVSSNYNVFIGYQSGQGDISIESSNSNNTLIGFQSGFLLTTGNNNNFIGYQSGNSVSSGSNNILLGYDTDTPASTTSNYLNIGDTIYGNLNTDNIGIGTTSPLATLDVYGNIIISDSNAYLNFGNVSGTTGYGFRDNSGTLEWKNSGGSWANLSGGGSGTVNSGTSGQLAYYGADGTAVSGTSSLFISPDGNVGVGTTTPNYKLDINGNINIASGSSYKINGSTILSGSNQSSPGNLFIGLRAGEDISSGNLNTFVGTHAGINTTMGGSNTYVGESAGNNNTTGNANVLIGSNAGSNMISGIRNTMIGTSVGTNNTSGSYNLFLGQSAGVDTSGSYNIMIGYMAGRGETNSNKLYITNSDTTATATLIYGEFDNNILSFNADVGIGTTTPGADLQVYGGDSATSTVMIGGDGNTAQGGCIKMKDYDGSGWTYLIVNNGTLSATTTPCN